MNRSLLGVLAFVAAMIAVPWGACLLMEASEVALSPIKLDYVRDVERVAKMVPPPSSRSYEVVLVFGDSLAAGFAPKRKVSDRLGGRFALDRDPPVRVASVAIPGTSAFDYYFLADLLLPTEPEVAVFFLNLASFSEGWRKTLLRPELVGWIGSDRWRDAARQPLAWVGLTWDRILLYQAIVHGGLADLWRRTTLQQARVAAARRKLEDALMQTRFRNAERQARSIRAMTILRRPLVPGSQRLTKEATSRHLGPVATGLSPSHPMLRILSETIRLFHAQGSDVLVCVMPIDVEHAIAVGAVDEASLRNTVDVIRDAVTHAGGELVDLHASFPDAAFRDAAGHLRDDDFDAVGRVAEVVEVMVRAQLAAPGKP